MAGSLVTRFGTVVGAGAIAAMLASLPAELRIGDGGSIGTAFQQWLALSAVLLPVGVLAALVFRRARVGLQQLAGEHVSTLGAGVLWWAVVELGLLSVFGALLRAKTHHHGLAGVTFAIFAVVSGIIVALVAARGLRALNGLGARWQRATLLLAALAAFASLVLVGVRTVRAPGLQTAAVLVDLFALCVASGIASSPHFAQRRPFAIIGVPIAAGVLALGLSLLRIEPDLRDAFEEHAPLHAWILDTVVPEAR